MQQHPPNPTSPDALPSSSTEQFQQVMVLLSELAQNTAPKAVEPKYLTVEDAAVYCRLAVQTIYNNRKYIARMPGVRKLLFTREALDAWLAKRPTTRHKRK
jgi:hypothetical protein